ncbi:hypothetical protein GCM10010174_05900 [Kutzneria viridogrisea]|uniref:Secreted protein n=2 Tax=Kutzneria TaxID=43356 RepID=W5WIJ9_9PSEU|nr:protealysin inhibitor emfourin [Kutzneria albida]AHH97999.1 hypothetical protein KALB_4637 [Kutzneria albida DSM 43870]MBA8924344.1 hypothetical protein [Kutzneria viridogrisea]
MKTTHHKLVLVLALLLGFLGTTCSASAKQAPVADTTAAKPAVSKVSVHTTGGFAGIDERRTATAATPGHRELFDLVQRADFEGLADSYVPKDQCCDHFRHTVDVVYTDGTHKTVETLDSSAAPQVLFQVIELTRKIGS